jgi:hypothetical protein
MAEMVAIFVIGSVFGGLIVAAWKSDIPAEPFDGIHSGPGDVEARARRVQ